MQVDRLVIMANQIADYFAAEPEAAVTATAAHLRRYWDPRMRREIVAFGAASGDGLNSIAAAAIGRLATDTALAASAQPAAGH